jgi:hypothetical protein
MNGRHPVCTRQQWSGRTKHSQRSLTALASVYGRLRAGWTTTTTLERNMSWTELGFQTVSNLGVIIGLFFLAAQLRQNNRIADANARMDRRNHMMSAYEFMLNSPGMLETMAKDAHGEDLNYLEAFRINIFWARNWSTMFFIYTEAPPVDAETVAFSRRNARLYRSYRSAWAERKQLFPPGFVKFMDDQILSAAQQSEQPRKA